MRYSNIWKEATITKVSLIAENVKHIELSLSEIPAYTPGSHIDVQIFIDNSPSIRSYSLIGRSEKGKPLTIAVKLLAESRGGSKYIGKLKEGQKIQISQPKNHFEMTFGRDNYILIAGGIGITPIIAMAQELKHKKSNFRLEYAGASRKEMPFLEMLSESFGDNLSCYIKDENQRLDIKKTIAELPKGTQLYFCGPMRMLDDIRQAWHDNGFSSFDLRYETFGTTGSYPTQSFKINLPRFNKTLSVSINTNLLDTLKDNGIEVMSDCLKGECGLCVVDIIKYTGKIDHRDTFFSEEQKSENKQICACVSRVFEGELTIDTSYRGENKKN